LTLAVARSVADISNGRALAVFASLRTNTRLLDLGYFYIARPRSELALGQALRRLGRLVATTARPQRCLELGSIKAASSCPVVGCHSLARHYCFVHRIGKDEALGGLVAVDERQGQVAERGRKGVVGRRDCEGM
jgi:hypothetical protein